MAARLELSLVGPMHDGQDDVDALNRAFMPALEALGCSFEVYRRRRRQPQRHLSEARPARCGRMKV